jgi:hypothetical protein
MIGMGFVNDWRLLVLCRTMLGVFESGMFFVCVFFFFFLPGTEILELIFSHLNFLT